MSIKIVLDLNTDGASLEELYLSKAILGMIDQGFQSDQIETPEWIADKMTAINAEITSRYRADLERRLKLAEARAASYASREEKRDKALAAVAELKKRLGK